MPKEVEHPQPNIARVPDLPAIGHSEADDQEILWQQTLSHKGTGSEYWLAIFAVWFKPSKRPSGANILGNQDRKTVESFTTKTNELQMD